MKPQETETVKATLISILHQGYLLNRNFITGSMGYNITTHLNFPKKMGTGNFLYLNKQYCTVVAN
jgi:hypothetical protein